MRALDAKGKTEQWPDFEAKFIAVGSRGQRGSIVHEVGERVKTGLWEADANVTSWLTYPCHELMVLLEGDVAIITQTAVHVFHPGDCFFIPLGLKCVWSQTGHVRKWFVAAFDGQVATGGSDVLRLDPNDQKNSFAISPTLKLWSSTTGFQAGIRKVKKQEKASKRHEFLHIVDGYCDGQSFFKAAGQEASFSGDVVAVYCSYDSDAPSPKL